MKKFVYGCCIFGMICALIVTMICVVCIKDPQVYHPLWILTAVLSVGMAIAEAMIANIYRTGMKGWQEEEYEKEREACEGCYTCTGYSGEEEEAETNEMH